MPLPAPKKPMFGVAQAASTAERFGSPGGAGMTAFQRSLYNQKSSATAGAFDNTRSRSRERALASGMDYTQDAVQANDTAIENERARAIGNIGSEVALESAPLEFQAAQLGLQGGRDLNTMQNESRKRKAGIAGALTRVGATIGGAFSNPNSRIGKILGGLSRF